DPVGTIERQGLEKDAANHAENGGIGANAEAEGEQGGQGEARGPPDGTQGIAEILAQLVEDGHAAFLLLAPLSFGATVSLGELEIAELAKGFGASVGFRHPAGLEPGGDHI